MVLGIVVVSSLWVLVPSILGRVTPLWRVSIVLALLLSLCISSVLAVLAFHVLLVLLLGNFRGNPAGHHHHWWVRATRAGRTRDKGAARRRHKSRAGWVLSRIVRIKLHMRH